MATRGRESNRLYVDTRYDPDSDTSHEQPLEVQPVDVLTQVLARSGADKSATETRHHELTNAGSPARSEAEGAAIHASAREQRYTDLLLAAGVTPGEIEAAKSADLWRPLLARMHHAERLGIHLDDPAKPAEGPSALRPSGSPRLPQIAGDLVQGMSDAARRDVSVAPVRHSLTRVP